MTVTNTIVKFVCDKFPSGMKVKSAGGTKTLEWIGKNISSPENRLIMGVTAIVSQPWIDLYNKDVDERTRKVSCARTAAKIIAGTITGVTIRYATIGAIKSLSKVAKNGETLKAFRKWFIPSNLDLAKVKAKNELECESLKQYQNTLGSILGIFVMLYTNFAIDIPLTKYFTKIFGKKLGVDETPSKISKNGGSK